MASYAVIAVVVAIGLIALFFIFKGSGGGSGGDGQKPLPLHPSAINCSAIPNKEPNIGNQQTPPFFRCGSSKWGACYDVGVSSSQPNGWYDMTGPGEICDVVPLCKDVAAKCNLSGLADL